ncbi:hypothetical protein ACQJBY_072412 [Aegilops geniculata]
MVVEGVAWGMSVAGWIMSPIISRLLDKALSYCKDDKKKTLYRLLTDVLPRLTLTLEAADAINHRVLFEHMVSGLKSAFYGIEDILDELEYIRHQEKLDRQKSFSSKKEKKKSIITLDAEAGPSNQDICIEPSLTFTAALNDRLKDNMAMIEELIDKAQDIIALAEPSRKDKTGTAKSTQASTTSDPTAAVIGRDEDRDRIAEMLRDEKCDGNPSSSISECFSVIGIYGISGSGKTTLAQHICKYEEDKNCFDLIMWIHVSPKFSVSDIFKEMFEAASVDKEKSCRTFCSLDILEKELKKKLEGKRFLLVLDDIWCDRDFDKQKLAKLLSPLKLGERGSKILATSRNKDAFSDLGPGVACTVFPISALDENVFLELFMYYALENTNADDSDKKELKDIGAAIALKLKGSPLAASTVGGQLRKRKNDVGFWREVQDRDLLNETLGALWWSYQHLDENVRRCFAYCSIFPERHRLYRDELVKLWVAEGFIQTTNAEEDMEAVGRDYFDELLATSFLQPGGYHLGSFYYLVHDLMHDLAKKAAGSDCLRMDNGSRREVPHDVRHLFVGNEEMNIKKIFGLKNLRTLIIDGKEWSTRLNEQFFDKVFKKLQKLRVLAVEINERRVFRIPDSIVCLKHLRYLALRMFGKESKLILPETLAKLYHLQVLILYVHDTEFPSDINTGNLTKLRHISGGQIGIYFPNIGRLTSLQTLKVFQVRTEHGQELKQLRDLNKLRSCLAIQSLENVKSKEEAHEAKLADKKGLQGLRLSWSCDSTCTPEAEAEVLEGLCPPKDLKSLGIMNYHGLRYPNWMVSEKNGGPKHLHVLKIRGCSRLGPAPHLFGFFIHLRELVISDCSWDCLPNNMKDLRSLKTLMIMNCLHLKSLPELPLSLTKFEVHDCNEVFMRSCQQVGDPNWEKIQHVGVNKTETFEVRLPWAMTFWEVYNSINLFGPSLSSK